MEATKELETEHRAIERMLKILDNVSQRLESNDPVNPEDLGEIVEFIQVFADRCHHGKEEDLLFVEMERAGISRQGGPIGVMLAEHAMGREHVRAMKEGAAQYEQGRRGSAAQFTDHARAYTSLLRQHIIKEDTILYPMANQVLSDDDQDSLLEGFETVEEERIGPGRHESFHVLLDELEAKYNG